jgi:hypothetical protein
MTRYAIGADISFRHGAAVLAKFEKSSYDDPVIAGAVVRKREITLLQRWTVEVPARRKGEDWDRYLGRGLAAHLEAIQDIQQETFKGLDVSVTAYIEAPPERCPKNQYQAPAVLAVGFWLGELISVPVAIQRWRKVWTPFYRGRKQWSKDWAISLVKSLGHGHIIDGLKGDLLGDVAEAALVAIAAVEGRI